MTIPQRLWTVSWPPRIVLLAGLIKPSSSHQRIHLRPRHLRHMHRSLFPFMTPGVPNTKGLPRTVAADRLLHAHTLRLREIYTLSTCLLTLIRILNRTTQHPLCTVMTQTRPVARLHDLHAHTIHLPPHLYDRRQCGRRLRTWPLHLHTTFLLDSPCGPTPPPQATPYRPRPGSYPRCRLLGIVTPG